MKTRKNAIVEYLRFVCLPLKYL